ISPVAARRRYTWARDVPLPCRGCSDRSPHGCSGPNRERPCGAAAGLAGRRGRGGRVVPARPGEGRALPAHVPVFLYARSVPVRRGRGWPRPWEGAVAVAGRAGGACRGAESAAREPQVGRRGRLGPDGGAAGRGSGRTVPTTGACTRGRS